MTDDEKKLWLQAFFELLHRAIGVAHAADGADETVRRFRKSCQKIE